MVLRTIIEGIVVAFVIWGLFHEEKLMAIEDKIIDKIFGGTNDEKDNQHNLGD